MADEPPSLWKDTPDDEWETPTPNEDPKQTEVDNQSKQEPTQPPKNGTCLSQDTQEQEPQWEIPKKQRQSRKPNNKREIKIQTENKFSELDSDSKRTSEQKIKRQRKRHRILVSNYRKKTAFSFSVFCLFDLIPYVPSTIFQLCRDGSSWVEPVLS